MAYCQMAQGYVNIQKVLVFAVRFTWMPINYRLTDPSVAGCFSVTNILIILNILSAVVNRGTIIYDKETVF